MLGSSSAIVIMLIVILLVGFAILAVLALTRGHGRRLLNKEKYRTAWLEIENNITKDNNASYQFAILSADKLLDKALKESGVPGETMGDRLKQSDCKILMVYGQHIRCATVLPTKSAAILTRL